MVQEVQQRGKLDRWHIAFYAALTASIDLVLGARHVPEVLSGGLINPDSYMRMVRLEGTLRAHHPTSIVLRDSSGHGTLIHWSHLLDSLVCVLATPFGFFMSQHAALHIAAALAGPLFMAGLGVAIAWAAAPFAERRLLWFGPLLAALSPQIVLYGLFGELHHHVPAVVVAVMAGGWAARIIKRDAPRHAGLALGAWAGLGIWLTPETAPLLLLSFGALWLVWVTAPGRTDVAAQIRSTGAAFLLVTLAAFLVDPPYEGYLSVEIDRISILFVGLALAIAAVAFGTWLIDGATARRRLRLDMRILLASLMGGACASIWIICFPTVLHGTDNMISAADWRRMFGTIIEMQPITGLDGFVRYLLTGALASTFLVWLAIRQRSIALGFFALCAAAMLVPAQQHMRFAAYPEAIAAIVLPVALTTAGQWFAARGEAFQAVSRVAIVAAFILVPYASGASVGVEQAHASESTSTGSKCSVAGLAPMLAPYSGQVVLASVNDTPELLYRTKMLTVGSLYHRGVAGFLRLRAAWRSGPSQTLPPAVAATKASILLFCPSVARSDLLEGLPPDTLLDRLNNGSVPPWLRLVAKDSASGNLLYKVIR